MNIYKKSLLIFLVIVVAGAAGTMYGYYERDNAVSVAETESASPQNAVYDAGTVTVYVTGAVQKPGVVTVAANSRVIDAVNACGGVLPTADAEKTNMAQLLKDGQQIIVYEKTVAFSQNTQPQSDSAQAAQKSAPSVKQSPAANEKVNINTADEKTLDRLPGVGPATAKKIVEYREQNGFFSAPEDLKKVRGIGEAKYEQMKDMVTLW